MKFEEYNELGRQSWPYKFSIQKNNQYIYHFGANHSCNPEDPQYPALRAFWAEFLEKTGKKNAVVFVEGGKRRVRSSEEEAIDKGAEADFITFLANKEGIETFSPEPPEKFRFEELLKKFTKEEIIYHDFVRMAYQWNRRWKKPDFEEYLNYSLAQDKENSGWYDFDFSIDHMIRLHKQISGRDFDKNDKDFLGVIMNPTTTFCRINELERFESDTFRDGYILEQIEKYWNEGKNLFIVYGGSHTIRQERAVRMLG